MIQIEEVNHIANLAKLKINKEEVNKYQHQLTDILKEIEKIIDLKIPDSDIMISPINFTNRYEDDVIGVHISKDLAFRNTSHVQGDYIIVPKVIE